MACYPSDGSQSDNSGIKTGARNLEISSILSFALVIGVARCSKKPELLQQANVAAPFGSAESLWCALNRLPGRRDAPDRVPDVIGHEQGTVSRNRNPHWAALRLAIGTEKTGQNVFWGA